MVEFTVTLEQKQDWDANAGGWRCAAVRIPGAEVQHLFADGRTYDPRSYTVKPGLGMILWSQPNTPPPDSPVVAIKLANDLDFAFWKKLAIVLPFVAAMFGAAVPLIMGLGGGVPSKDVAAAIAQLPVEIGCSTGGAASAPGLEACMKRVKDSLLNSKEKVRACEKAIEICGGPPP